MIIIKKHSYLSLFLIFLLFIVATISISRLSGFAFAQEEEQKQEKVNNNKNNKKEYDLSQKELVVISFFRLAGVSPDYDAWIKNSATYSTMVNESEQRKFLVDETIRLGRGYSLYNPNEDFIEFDTGVVVRYIKSEDGKTANFYFKFPEESEDYIPVFEYQYGRNSIALIINNFAQFSKIKLNQKQTEKVASIMPYEDEEYMAKLTMKIRPLRAEYDKPIITKDIYQWMMLGDMAYMKCQIIDPISLQKTDLWDYIAPWYEKKYKEQFVSDESKYPHPYDLFNDKKYN